jgi:hypothetical protein
MPNGDTQDFVIKTDGGTFRIKVPKGMEQGKALSLAAATNPKFAEIYPQVQARLKTQGSSMEPSWWGGIHPTKKGEEALAKITPEMINQRATDIRSAVLAAGGAGIGAKAESLAEGLPAFIRVMAGASGAGAGAGVGALAGGSSPKEALTTAAQTTGTSAVLSPFIKWLGSSKTVGAKLLQRASQKAGNAPVELSPRTNELVDKLVESSKLGGKSVKVVSDLLERVGPSTKQAAEAAPGPLTYDEARILQGNMSALSAEEQMSLKGTQKGLMKQLAASFSKDVQIAADKAGVGKFHARGMKEFATASSRNRTMVKVGKAAATGAGIVGAEELIRRGAASLHP